MIGKVDKIIFSAIAVVAILGFVFWKDINPLAETKDNAGTIKKDKNEKKKNKEANLVDGVNDISQVIILEKWELPAELLEVSGIAWIDNERFACIQDEKGSIFIYNRVSNKIEKEIPFAGAGDYEGLTINQNLAYVVRSDGRLYEVDLNVGQASTKEYSTLLTVKQNVEGLCYDKNNNRLLLAIKGNEPSNVDYKGIYAFDISKKSFISDPVFKLNLNDQIINGVQNKKKKSIMPSSIGIHPLTKEIFITDGTKSNLLILDPSGNSKRLIRLGSQFAQPEGITFSPEGEIYISNEGTKQPGNILKVELKKE